MNFDLSEEQALLADQARALLSARANPDRLRALIAANEDCDESLWKELASMGYLGAAIPEAYGGLGLTQLDLGVISEELGRANAPLPFFSSIVLAADALALAGTEQQKTRWLPQLATGEQIGTLAYAEGSGGWQRSALRTVFENGRLSGIKTPVADAGIAGLAIVLASMQGQPVLALVDLNQSGVTRTRLNSFDQLRPHYELRFEQVAAELLADEQSLSLQYLFDRAAAQLAFEAVGGAHACLTMARDYAMERQIFGRPLASFQAIKHKLADLAVAIELARSNAYYAAWAVDHAPAEVAAAASAAWLTATEAFETGARENLQVHGGIGYTWEANCHFYYRRERTLAVSLGSREFWADRLIASELSAGSGE
jgi:acyl-CoA dehydrogenase